MPAISEFEPQLQEHALTPEALNKLTDLKKLNSTGSGKLDERLKNAIEFLATSAGEINDRAYQERVQHQKKIARLLKNGEAEPDEEAAAFEEFQDQVNQITKKLDLGTRKIIDDRVSVEDVPGAINHAVKQHASAMERLAQTHTNASNEESMSEEQEDEKLDLALPPTDNVMVLLREEFSDRMQSWNAMSLAERYSKNDDYKDFYRTVFDANHQDGNPPMPPANQWFAAEEGRVSKEGVRSSQRGPRATQADSDIEMAESSDDALSDEAESDIEIHAERTRLTCPITLKYFEEPLKSTKCPHAFEKRFILRWLHESTDRGSMTQEQMEVLSQTSDPTERGRRAIEFTQRIVRCPECAVPLTEKDLRPDPVLVRMVKRELEKQKREAEQEQRFIDTAAGDEDSEEDDMPRPSQRRKVVNVGSSPARSVRPRRSEKHVKSERHSMVPQTQYE